MVAEPQRLAYLQALGVANYYPRRILPNALRSKQCEAFAVPPASESVVQQPSEVEVKPPAAAAADLSALFDSGETATPVARKKPAAAIQQPHERPNKVPEFALSWLMVKDSVLFIDQGISHHVDQQDYRQLALNICRALQMPAETVALEHFVWPMIRSQQVEQGEAAARDALQAFCQRQMQQFQPRCVLLMSATAVRYLPISSFSQPVREVDSLQQLLLQPERKALFWQQIKSLITEQ